MRTVTALILAAGFSRRLGRPKALVTLPDGMSLLTRAISVAREAGLPVTVAANGEVADEARRYDVTVVPVPDAAEGMAASIRAGVATIDTDVVLILLADQWAVTGDDLSRLVRAWRDGDQPMAAASYEGRAGVPAIFSRSHFGKLQGLAGDHGARELLRGRTRDVLSVWMPNAGLDCDDAIAAERVGRGASDDLPRR